LSIPHSHRAAAPGHLRNWLAASRSTLTAPWTTSPSGETPLDVILSFFPLLRSLFFSLELTRCSFPEPALPGPRHDPTDGDSWLPDFENPLFATITRDPVDQHFPITRRVHSATPSRLARSQDPLTTPRVAVYSDTPPTPATMPARIVQPRQASRRLMDVNSPRTVCTMHLSCLSSLS
jgi:hypothetical protein